MPEAPEVQTVLSTLEHQIQGSKVLQVDVIYPKLIDNCSLEVFEDHLTGQTFRNFYRYGKYLIFEMDDVDWVAHMRMEGKFYLFTYPKEDKHIHLRMKLSDGRWLCYHDTRKFGRMDLYKKRSDPFSLPCFYKLGPDVLDERFDPIYFYTKVHRMKKSIKACLLDQSIVAGIGNIYADEICFSCCLDPRSRSYRISKKDCENIVFHSKRIIKGAIRAGGTTIRSYTSSLGVTGRFQLELKVHAHQGDPCPICHTTIQKIVVAQRGTYLCPKCQKRK